MSPFTAQRPPVSARRFTREAVASLIPTVGAHITDPEPAGLFGNRFPNTQDTTIDVRGPAPVAHATDLIYRNGDTPAPLSTPAEGFVAAPPSYTPCAAL